MHTLLISMVLKLFKESNFVWCDYNRQVIPVFTNIRMKWLLICISLRKWNKNIICMKYSCNVAVVVKIREMISINRKLNIVHQVSPQVSWNPAIPRCWKASFLLQWNMRPLWWFLEPASCQNNKADFDGWPLILASS